MDSLEVCPSELEKNTKQLLILHSSELIGSQKILLAVSQSQEIFSVMHPADCPELGGSKEEGAYKH